MSRDQIRPPGVRFPEPACRYAPGEADNLTLTDQAICIVACGACGFHGHDDAFTAYPGQAYRSPGALVEFAERQSAEHQVRICPGCSETAPLAGFELRVYSGSLDRDLLLRLTAESPPVFLLVSPGDKIEAASRDDPRILDVCHDSCIRGAMLSASLQPGRIEHALDLLALVQQARPREPLPLLFSARLLAGAGRLDAAMDMVAASAPLAGECREATALRAEVLGEIALQGRDPAVRATAIRAYRDLLGRDSGLPEERFALARLLLDAGEYSEARGHFTFAKRAAHLAIESLFFTGVAYFQEGLIDEALAGFRRIERLAPGEPQVLDMLAWCHCKRGDEASLRALLDSCSERSITLPSEASLRACLPSPP